MKLSRKQQKQLWFFLTKQRLITKPKKIQQISQEYYRNLSEEAKKFLKSNHANTRNQKLTQIDKEEKNI